MNDLSRNNLGIISHLSLFNSMFICYNFSISQSNTFTTYEKYKKKDKQG